LPVLSCQRCGKRLAALDDGALSCAADGSTATIKDGKVFWITVPDDVVPPPMEGARDPNGWTSWRRANFVFYRDLLVSTPHARLLDLGAGRAQFHDLFTGAQTFVAADFFPYPDVNLICDLTQRLPLASDVFDVIVASNVFEHLPNTADVLRECHRVLRPGATLLATIPFLVSVHQAPYDFHRYTPFMLKRLLEDAGFGDIEIKPLATPGDLYTHTLHQFFGMLFNHTTRITSTWERASYWIRLKTLWKAHQLLHLLESGLIQRLAPHEEFTLGFGFTAKKPLSPTQQAGS
jgi:SAM-dependent methyltransferase